MTPIRVGIWGDSAGSARDLQTRVQELGYHSVNVATSCEEAEHVIDDDQPDVLLVDVRLPADKEARTDFVMMLRDWGSVVPIVFISTNGDRETVECAKKAAPAGFLIKPFGQPDLYACIEVAHANRSRRQAQAASAAAASAPIDPTSFFVKQETNYYKVQFRDVLFLKGDNKWTELLTSGRTLSLHESLTNCMENFGNSLLCRVHQSYAVNPEQITSLEADYLLIGSHHIPISKQYRQELYERLKVA